MDRFRDLRYRKDGHDIVRCASCGTLFRADLPDADELSRIYGREYFTQSGGDSRGQGYSDYVGEERYHRTNARARLELLGHYSRPGALLDVGCAAGFFLDEAHLAGWRVEGVELSTEMAAHARGLGLAVEAVPFAELHREPETFDAITMWDYIEHTTDPLGDLERSFDLLTPGGLLAVSTGDAASLVARLSGSRWHLLTPRHHNFFFTRRSLEQAFRRVGLKVVLASHLSNRYSVQYLAHKLRTMVDLQAVSRVADRLARMRAGRISIPVNLYDIVTVVGRRE